MNSLLLNTSVVKNSMKLKVCQLQLEFKCTHLLGFCIGFLIALPIQAQTFEEKPIQFDYSYLSKKSRFNELNPSPNSIQVFNSSSIKIPAETDIMVMVYNQCAVQGEGGTLSQSAFQMDQYHPSLKVQAYSVQLNQDTLVSDLESMAESDPCLYGITEEGVAQLSVFPGEINDDPNFSQQTAMESINLVQSHNLFYKSSLSILSPEPVVIAIVDTGVAVTHPDLMNVLWNDGNGNAGFDFVNNDNNPDDDNGHGTHCAGLAAAQSSNGVGISGVLGFNQKIMGVKVMRADGSGSSTDIFNGIRYAADNGADVMNLSIGGGGSTEGAAIAYRDVLQHAVNQGTTVLVAAGNNGFQINSGANFIAPAGYARQVAGAISVGSFDASDPADLSRSNFSNFSTAYVEYSAPGSISGTAGLLSTFTNDGYSRLQGTSMATPVASGATGLVIALLRQNGIDYTPAEIESILINAAVKNPNLNTFFQDGNQLDVEKLGEYIFNSYIVNDNGGF